MVGDTVEMLENPNGRLVRPSLWKFAGTVTIHGMNL